MKISVCLPVMGRSQWLCQALYSYLIQGYEDFEVVIKDGDPEHPVLEDPIVKPVAALFGDKIKYKVGKDRGIFDATNDCLRRATGDILNFACSDDMVCPGAFIAVNEVFTHERFGGPFWLFGKTISADISGKSLGIDGAPTTYEKLLQHNQIGQPATFWNRQIMEMDGMFDIRYKYAADYDLWLRFFKRCEPYFLDQTLGIFRHHGEQATAQTTRVEREAKNISIRYNNFDSLIQRARNRQNTLRHYGDQGLPETVN